MKRIIVFALIGALCAAVLAGCGDKAASSESGASSGASDTSAASSEGAASSSPATSEAAGTQIPSPIEERASLDEINAAAGTDIHSPAGLEVTGEAFSVITSDPVVAQYTFTCEGGAYTLRAAKTEEDISGVWEDGKTLTDLAAERAESGLLTLESALWQNWTDGEVQYSLYAEGADAESFAAVFSAVQ